MGIIIAKFRKNKSTFEILDKLENEITCIEAFGRSTEQSKKKIMRRFISLTITVTIVMFSILYFYYNKISYNGKWISITAFLVSPFVLFIIKRILMWYYNRKIRRNEKKLIKLKEDKKKILDNVMETETYKVAKKILDKFGNGDTQKSESNMELALFKGVPSAPASTALRKSQIGIRQRIVATSTISSLSTDRAFLTPIPRRNQINSTQNQALAGHNMNLTPFARSVPLALPRVVLPQQRSVLDKVVDYLVGEGPSNRYALICNNCSGHNGMALKDEFEYLSFKCCFCSHFNPARKQRPTAPAIENSSPIIISGDSSESEDSSEPISDSTEPMRNRESPELAMSIDSSQAAMSIESPETSGRSDSPDIKSNVEMEVQENVISTPEPIGAAGDGNIPDTTHVTDGPGEADGS